MKLSIITASYNSAATIRDTLRTVAMQHYNYIEHIIIDGASQDETLKIVSEFPHVSSIVCEKDKGIYDAMNKGLAKATGEVIGILNSDDFYADETVLSKVMALFEDPSVDAVYGDLVYVSATNTQKIIRNWKSGKYTLHSFYRGWMPPHPSFFVRSTVYERYGHFDLRLRSAADYELMLRFLLKHQIHAVYLPHRIVCMRTGGASNASLKHRIHANREDRMAWKLNGLKPFFFTLWLKPVRKIVQYFN